jgi:hypothetical protein
MIGIRAVETGIHLGYLVFVAEGQRFKDWIFAA